MELLFPKDDDIDSDEGSSSGGEYKPKKNNKKSKEEEKTYAEEKKMAINKRSTVNNINTMQYMEINKKPPTKNNNFKRLSVGAELITKEYDFIAKNS